MIVQCPDCSTRYQLDPVRVPPQRVRVRCPNCRYVFPIDGALAARGSVTAAGVSRPVQHVAERSAPIPSAPAAPARAADHASPRAPGQAPVHEPVRAPVHAPAHEPALGSEHSKGHEQIAASHTVTSAPQGFDLQIERHGGVAPRVTSPDTADSEAHPAVRQELPSALATAVHPEPSPEVPAQDESEKKARRLARALVSDILVYNRELRDKALAEGNLVQALGHEIKKSFELFKERCGADVQNPRHYFVEALNDILADGQKVF